MSTFFCKTRNKNGRIEELYITAEKCNYFPDDYLLGSFAQFYTNGLQVHTVYRLVEKPVEMRAPAKVAG